MPPRPAAAPPLCRRSIPPPLPFPAAADTDPPADAELEPPETLTVPAEPPSPAAIVTEPALPSPASPVPICTEPDAPDATSPVARPSSPLEEEVDDDGVSRESEPLRAAELTPLDSSTDPPADVSELPAPNSRFAGAARSGAGLHERVTAGRRGVAGSHRELAGLRARASVDGNATAGAGR